MERAVLTSPEAMLYDPRKCCSVVIIAEEPLVVGGEQSKADKASETDETFRGVKTSGPKCSWGDVFCVLLMLFNERKKNEKKKRLFKEEI